MWLAVVTGGVDLWGFWWWSPAVVPLAPLMIIGGLVGVAYTWLVGSPRSRVFQRVTLGAVIVTVLFPQSIEISTRAFYATDSAAFDQVAASALVHGADPYVASMSGVARLLDCSIPLLDLHRRWRSRLPFLLPRGVVPAQPSGRSARRAHGRGLD